MKKLLIVMILFLVPNISVAKDSAPKSFNEMIDEFKLSGVETKSDYTYNKNNMYRVDEEHRLHLYRKYGNDFYIIEFFLNPKSAYQVNELKGAVKYAVSLRDTYKNVILKVFLAGQSSDESLGLMAKLMIEHPEFEVYRASNPVPDLGAISAYARGVKSLPTMVVTKGYGKNNNVALVTKGFKEFLSSIPKMKKLKKN